MEEKSYLQGRLLITVGDITGVTVDGIVNAANSSLMGGGGVDGAIHSAGGRSILRECRALRQELYPDGLPPGKAVATTAGRLPAKYVIHTVGPVYAGGAVGEAETLASAYTESLIQARDLGLASVAFPSISTGVYGYPKADAAMVAFSAIKRFLDENPLPEQVLLVFFSRADARVFIRTVQDRAACP